MKTYIFFTLLALSLFALTGAAQNQDVPRPDQKALEMMTRGDFRGALEALDAVINKNKDLYANHKLRATIRRMTGNFAGALADLDKAVELRPDDGELYEQRAMLRLYTRQDTALVLEDFDRAIANGRKFEKVYSMRAMIRRQAGDEAGAIADYETAIGMRPDFASAHVGLASIYSMRGDDEKAAAILENFLGLIENSGAKTPKVKGQVTASTSVDLPVAAGSKTQVTENAIIISSPGVKLNGPPSPEEMNRLSDKMEQSKNTALAYTNLAAVYERRREYDKALATVDTALRLDPTDFAGFATRGRIKNGLGDYAGALADLDAAIKMMPGKSTAHLDRGIALLMLGRTAEADAAFAKHLEIFPNAREMVERRIAEAKEKAAQ